MFDRFTNETKTSMNLARREAQRFGHDFMGPEHRLLGVLGVEACAARVVVEKLGLDVEEFRARFERSSIVDSERSALPQLSFSPAGRRALELSFEEAPRLEHSALDTAEQSKWFRIS
jgi:ATP-dependent Clp protease ATP-binding subunit ClpC